MKQQKIILMSAAAMMALLTACSGFKMGELTSENFKVTPNPLEVEQGQVTATVNGVFPEKFMDKNARLVVYPELRYTKNGEQLTKTAQAVTFIGEKVVGNEQTISYKDGGYYNQKTTFDYEPAMQQSELWMRAEAYHKDKKVELPAVKVAQGVLATSELYHQTLTTAQPCMAADSYQRVIAQKQEANIKFLIQQAELRKSELKNNSVQEFVNLLQRISADREGMNLKNVEVSAYASPDGGFDLNEKLANKRQQNTETYVKDQLKKSGVDGDVEASYTAQDWEGFQQLVQTSDIQDKDVIVRVLSMYKDPQEREQQIKNMSHGFKELADGILPQLRRSRLIINYETVGRSDQQILSQLKSDPKQLSIEELLYAASLVKTDSEREAVYKSATQCYPNDSRAYNNLAALAYSKGNYGEAQQMLNKAATLNGSSAEVNANKGLLALKQGDTKTAEMLISKAATAGHVNETIGNLHLAQGNYAQAEKDFEGVNSNSSALAQIMNKNYAKASRTLQNVQQPDGMTDYLKAIISARQGNKEEATRLLNSALAKDPSLKAYADNDMEFETLNK